MIVRLVRRVATQMLTDRAVRRVTFMSVAATDASFPIFQGSACV